MIELTYDLIISLRNEVLRRFGVEVIQPGDCKHLSQSILANTTKLVSETTLKRVFGFAATQHGFSRYTLNTLSQYCQFKTWEEFQQHHFKQLHKAAFYTTTADTPNNDEWTQLKIKADAVSRYTRVTLKNRSGIAFPNTVNRPFCNAHIEKFLKSNYTATALIAPSGWGKSLAMVHLAEHYWFGNEARYKQDVCWFINAHAAGCLLQKGFCLSTWLDNQMNLGDGENLREYYANHFSNKGGRLILLIDGFDEIIAGEQLRLLYTKLENFIYSNDLYPWVKVILSIRSNTWAEVFQHSRQYPAFKRCWYLGAEMDEETNINMPQLTAQEVKNILYNHPFDPATIKMFSENFLQKLKHPYYLQLFCQLNSCPDQPFVDEHFSLFEIVSQFIQQRLFNAQSNSYKIQIIETLINLLNLGKNGINADKNLLLAQNLDLFPAYKELLTDNILVEENLSQEIMFTVKVRFAHVMLLEYFVAMHYLKKNNNEINEQLLADVLHHLLPSTNRLGILRWLLRYAINHKQSASILTMLYLPLTNLEKSYLLEYLVLHCQHDGVNSGLLRSIFPKGFFKTTPISPFITDEFIQHRKRKVLTALLELAETREDKHMIKSKLFLIALLQLDAEQCEQELSYIKKINPLQEVENKSWVNPYHVQLFIYEFLKFGIVNESVQKQIYNYGYLIKTGKGEKTIPVMQEIIIRNMGIVFTLLEDYHQLLRFITQVFATYPSLQHRRTDVLRLQLLCWQAQACLHTGDTVSALRICKHTEQVLQIYSSEYTDSKYLEAMLQYLYATFYYKKQVYNKAIQTAETAVEHAAQLNYRSLMLMNFGLLSKIYHHLHMDKQKNNICHQIALINNSTSFKQAVFTFAK